MTGRRPTMAIAAATGLCAVALTACASSGPQATPQPSPSVTSPYASPVTPVPSSLAPSSLAPSPPTPSPSRPTSVAGSLPGWLGGAPVTRLPTSRRVVALTFDGGAGAQGAAAIVAALTQAGVPATFFLTGQFVRSFPHTVATLREHRYRVGNHTVTHPHLTQLSSAAVVEEVSGAQAQLKSVLGVTPRPLFRFPYGEYDARLLRLVHSLGYGAIGWTVDTRGWQGLAAGSVDDVVDRVRKALQPGAIVLMHLGANPDDGTTFDAAALPRVIATIRAAGYTFTDLLNW